jgi:hypothetical protein
MGSNGPQRAHQGRHLRRRLKEDPNLADYLAAAGFQHHDDPPLRATLDPDLEEDLAAMRGEYVHAKDGQEEQLPDKTIDATATNKRVVPIRRAIPHDEDDAPRDGDDP